MNFVAATPPRPVRKRRVIDVNLSYAALMSTMAAQRDTWFLVDGNVVAGASNWKKQNSLSQAARRRGYHIQTSVQDGVLYARIVTVPDEVL
jgi:hypothetical protein